MDMDSWEGVSTLLDFAFNIINFDELHIFRVSYTSLRSEDSSLVPDAHVKEQRRLEKMFR